MEITLVRPRSRDHFSTMRFAAALESGSIAAGVALNHQHPSASRFAKQLHAERIDGYLQRAFIHPRSLANSRADVFHILDHSYAGAARFLPPRRTIVTCHDLIPLTADSADMPAHVRRGRRRFRRNVEAMATVAAVVCVSQATRRDVLRLTDVSADSVHVIPAGVAPSFRPTPPDQRAVTRRRLGVDERAVLLSVSSGGFYKNTAAGLRALATLRASGRDAVLLRVGKPLEGDMRKLAAQLEISPHVQEMGRPSDDELVGLYGAADVLLFPSLHEGFGLPVLEAMACGTPVVAAAIPALEELLDGAGITAAPNDTEGLAHAVEDVLSVPLLADRLRRAGLARAESFRWDRVVAAYHSLYALVSNGADGSPPSAERHVRSGG